MTWPPPPPDVAGAADRRPRIWLRVVLVSGLLLGVLTLGITLLVIGPRTVRVQGHSMEPALQDDDRAVFIRLRGAPARGDVVAMRYPRNPSKSFLMRVVGLPRERVSIADGVVAIDGRPLDEPYISPERRSHDAFGPLLLGADEYFVLGDNRRNASDSREWGPVARRLIWARFHAIWWRR